MYYKDQLNKLVNSEWFKSLKIFDGSGNSTHQMNLNTESIPILIEFLKKEQKRLKLLGDQTK